jgi:TRAP-type C4-dicarboxylate transport system permease large subunit
MFALTGITEILVGFLSPESVAPIVVVIGIMALYVVLGCFMSAPAMLFLTVPFVIPIINNLGINPVWFGVLVVHMCEVGSITPPFGITLFAVKSILPPEVKSTTVIRGAIPFFAAYIVVLAILLTFPQIVLFLPGLMK